MRVRRDDEEEGRERDGGLEASFARCSFQSEAEQGREGGQSQKYMGLGCRWLEPCPLSCLVILLFSFLHLSFSLRPLDHYFDGCCCDGSAEESPAPTEYEGEALWVVWKM